MKNNIILKDIATKLNVSISTVSFTLSGRGDKMRISKNKQELIRKCAEELNYSPNQLAQALISGQSKTLGLIIPEITDSFFSTLCRKIEFEATHMGYAIMIASSESDVNLEDKAIALFQSKQVDGIIIAPTQDSEVTIKKLVDTNFPVVIIDRIFENINANSIIVDNFEASYNIVSKMIENGAKKIAFLTANPNIYTMKERRAGYQKAILDANIKLDDKLIGVASFQNFEDEILHIIGNIINQVPDVDGFFFATHVLALESFRFFIENDIDIKKSFQLGCIHGSSIFKALAPNIHVAYMPVEIIGEKAVELIVDNIASIHQNKAFEQSKIVIKCTYPSCLDVFKKGI